MFCFSNSLSTSTPETPRRLARSTIFAGSKRPLGKSDALRNTGTPHAFSTLSLNESTKSIKFPVSSSPRVCKSARHPSIEARGAPAGDVV